MTRAEALAWQERLSPRQLWRRYIDSETPHPDNSFWGHAPTLPEICLDLRQALNGSADPWRFEDVKACRDMLRARLDTWTPPTPSADGRIDEAVYTLVLATVCAADEWLLANQPKRGE